MLSILAEDGACILLPARRLEEGLHKAAELQIAGVVGGLAEVGVDAQAGHFLAVAFGIGRSNHDDGRAGAAPAAAQMTGDFVAGTAGEIDIQQDQVGAGRGGIGIGVFEEANGLFAVREDVEVGVELRGLKGLADQEDIGAVIFDEQDARTPPAGGRFRGGR